MFSLIAFRALQGIGAGAVQPVAYTIVGDIYSPTERAHVQGFLSSVFGFSAVIGPTLGAFLVEHADWSIVFWINLPIGALAIAMLAAFLREQPHPRPPRSTSSRSLLLMLGAGALMLAMIQGGKPQSLAAAGLPHGRRRRAGRAGAPRTPCPGADAAVPVVAQSRHRAGQFRQLRHRRGHDQRQRLPADSTCRA